MDEPQTMATTETEVIDAYTHILTEDFHETLTADYDFQGLSGSPAWLWNVEKRFEDMDDYGIDKQVITLALPPLWRGMDPEEALPLVELANDEIRRLADEHPDRFIPVGTLPFATEEYRDEYRRCVDDLGLKGVQLFSNVDGRPIDSPAFEALFEQAADDGVPLWLHPQLYEWYEWADEYMDHRLFGWPFDTTLALSRLVFSGIIDRNPNLKLVSHHGGGMVPFYGKRIEMFFEQRMRYPENYPGVENWPEYNHSIEESFQSFFADTAVSGSTSAIDCAMSYFGSDHILFGTDYPFSPERGRTALRTTVDAIEGASFDEQERTAVYAGNLDSILP